MKIFTNVKITTILCGACLLSGTMAYAQEPARHGQLSGSYETNTIWYYPDETIYNSTNRFPEDRLGSNNYLKLDYSLGKFSAGVQGEFYAPVLQGYPEQYKGAKFTNKFVGWTDDNFFITVGDFYDQYGSGLIFRSYEDRALGINTAVEGVKAGMNFGNTFAIRAMLGRPRLYFQYAPSFLRGADASLSLSSLFGFESQYLAIEGSYLSQYDIARTEALDAEGHSILSADMNAWSARVVYEALGFSGRLELVGKSPSNYIHNGEYVPHFGRGQLLELGYSGYGWGISLTARNISYMEMLLTASKDVQYLGLGNTLNSLPSLTRQYTYNLANLSPYQVKPKGDRSVQLDVFYNIAKKTKLGGKYGTKLHVNASIAQKPASVLFEYRNFQSQEEADKMEYAYVDANFDIEKQWNKKFKTTALFAFQRLRGETNSNLLINRYIIVADGLYKFTPTQSLRVEMQYLYSPFAAAEGTSSRDNYDTGDWWAFGLEYGIAPRFSFFVTDMYNFQREQVHYYNVGMSYTQARTRIALSYGRSRAGFVCSGGVCRNMPGYAGFNLSLTSSF